MHDEGVGTHTAGAIESIELCRCFLIYTFSEMNDPWPLWRRTQIGIAYLLVAIDVQGMRPAIVGEDARRETLAQQKWIERIVMRDGGDTAEQILHPADQQALIQRHGNVRFECRFSLPAQVNLRNPLARMAPVARRFQRRQCVEVKMIVRVDQTG